MEREGGDEARLPFGNPVSQRGWNRPRNLATGQGGRRDRKRERETERERASWWLLGCVTSESWSNTWVRVCMCASARSMASTLDAVDLHNFNWLSKCYKMGGKAERETVWDMVYSPVLLCVRNTKFIVNHHCCIVLVSSWGSLEKKSVSWVRLWKQAEINARTSDLWKEWSWSWVQREFKIRRPLNI